MKLPDFVLSWNNYSVMRYGFIYQIDIFTHLDEDWRQYMNVCLVSDTIKMFWVFFLSLFRLSSIFLCVLLLVVGIQKIWASQLLWPDSELSVMADYLPPALLEACVVMGASSDKLQEVCHVCTSKYTQTHVRNWCVVNCMMVQLLLLLQNIDNNH